VQQQIGRLCRKIYKNNRSERDYLERCLEGYRRAVKLRPNKLSFHEEFVMVCVEFGKTPEAVELMRNVLRMDPSRESMFAMLAMNKARGSSPEDRQMGVRLAQVLVEATGGAKVKPMVNLGRVLTAVGMTDQARLIYQRAIGLPEVRKNARMRAQIEQFLTKLTKR